MGRLVCTGHRGLVMSYRRSAGLLVSLAALSVIIPAARADPPAGAGAGKVAPFQAAGGVSAEEVLIASFTPAYTGEPVPACGLLGEDKLLFAQPESTCTIKPGTKVLVPLPGTSCSDAEPPPFFAETAAEQRACALASVRQDVLQVTVSVDGGPPQNVHSDRFLVITDQFGVISQPGNPFGARPGPTTVVAVGYLGVVRGLPPGRHTFVVSGSFFGSFTFGWTVDVVPGADR
jgi:hypothetical protein